MFREENKIHIFGKITSYRYHFSTARILLQQQRSYVFKMISDNSANPTTSIVPSVVKNTKPLRFHAHWDCFSGAAGDMMLAACLDAATTTTSSVDIDDNSVSNGISIESAETFLKKVEEAIKMGLPDRSTSSPYTFTFYMKFIG